ncbi:hypothetical protein MHU86_20790 [Fragilaria crotonensis]|nr:hypothetical protein MHU86_20790 [Fragilaria crotonensis]
MKLLLVLLSTLAFAAAKKSSLRSADDMVVTVQETHYTFDVDADIEPEASAAVDDFVSACLTKSFNTIHDPKQYRVIAVDVESEIVVPDSNNFATSVAAAPTRSWSPFRYGYWGDLWTVSCRYCNPDLLTSEHDYPAWEEAFCTCLQGSSDEVIATATMCHIERSDHAVEDVILDSKVVDAATGNDMVVTVQETHYTFDVDADIEPDASAAVDDFVSTCLTKSFNAIHDPKQYRVIAVDVESEIVVPDSNNFAASVPAAPTRSYPDLFPSHAQEPFRYGYWGDLWTVSCRYCNPDLLTSEHDYPAWEEGFCTCLQGSSDEVIATATMCHIDRPDDSTTDIVAANMGETSTKFA